MFKFATKKKKTQYFLIRLELSPLKVCVIEVTSPDN